MLKQHKLKKSIKGNILKGGSSIKTEENNSAASVNQSVITQGLDSKANIKTDNGSSGSNATVSSITNGTYRSIPGSPSRNGTNPEGSPSRNVSNQESASSIINGTSTNDKIHKELSELLKITQNFTEELNGLVRKSEQGSVNQQESSLSSKTTPSTEVKIEPTKNKEKQKSRWGLSFGKPKNNPKPTGQINVTGTNNITQKKKGFGIGMFKRNTQNKQLTKNTVKPKSWWSRKPTNNPKSTVQTSELPTTREPSIDTSLVTDVPSVDPKTIVPLDRQEIGTTI
jgi:hypothetical protein